MVSKWIRAGKSEWGLGAYLTLFNKVHFYCGTADNLGVAINISLYDRSLTFQLLHIYAGFEVFHGEDPELIEWLNNE
jgi:hypothetical protein